MISMCQDMPKLCLSLAFETLSNLCHRPAQFHLPDPLPSSPLFLPRILSLTEYMLLTQAVS